MNPKAVFEMFDDYMAELEAEKAKELAKREQENTTSQYSPEPKEIEKEEVIKENVNIQADLPKYQPDEVGVDGGSGS